MDRRKCTTELEQAKRRSVHMGFKSPLLARSAGGQESRSASSPVCVTSSSAHSQTVSQRPVGDTCQQQQHMMDTTRLQKEVAELEEQLREVEQQIYKLKDEGLDESELAEHITKLHEYNEIKDTAQMVLGHIATLQGVRTRDVYPKYRLELDD
ncbi:DNA repair protein SWI5 homolog [Littorina saxatilis]|uniref:DNA repair protein SWI5 homolog n=1 Tax=Littorina saxatilis TaxID=31220 RepID=A0AAN9AXG8_9CAEN